MDEMRLLLLARVFKVFIALGFPLSICLVSSASYAQSDTFRLRVIPSAGPIKVDGILDEVVWQSPEAATGFWEKWPKDNQLALAQTEVRVAFHGQYLYIGATCYDTSAYTIQTLKRDTRYWDSDGFAVVLDPVNQRANGFFFGVSPLNVQSEALLGSGFEEASFSWDNRWYSATQNYPGHWTVEMAIPLKTLRYKAGHTIWGINFIRNDLRHNQYSTWTRMPVQFNGTDLGYTGQLRWDEAPEAIPGNLAFIPYIFAAAAVDPENNAQQPMRSFEAGLDAKVALGAALNLDLTINPDFSQVEVDQQVTNLTRFNIFFPERRTFFLENDDLFSAYGFPETRPFFSRSIGLDDEGQPIPIWGGARITGNLGPRARVGLMNMQTRATADFDAQNYTAFSANYRVLSRSLVKAYATNRQNTSPGAENRRDYGRNYGTELVYQNDDGDWVGWLGLHQSAKDGYRGENGFYQAGGGYFGNRFMVLTDVTTLGTNYFADMGFIARALNYDAARDTLIRLGFWQNYTEVQYFVRPEASSVIEHRFGLEHFMVWNPDGSFNERFNRLRYFLAFRNTSQLAFRFDQQHIHLLYPFTFAAAEPLPTGDYHFSQFNAEYTSDARQRLAWEASFRVGGFYNGSLRQYRAALIYRQQPWGNFALNFELNELSFPEPYGETRLFLVSPRIEVNFSNSLFWTTFLQFNTQRENFNINSRLQWRFQPMSDLFLVYTDNYTADFPLINKNRAVVLKLNYWWAL
jgi:hypothetical protein